MNILEVLSPSKFEKKIVKIPLDLIDRSINVNPRSSLIMENVEKLVEAKDFPEIHLGYLDGKLIIVDGYHRDVAAQKLEEKEILAYITEYKTLSDLKIDAFKENVNHGIKLSDYDVAAWIYNNFLEASQNTPTVSLSSFTKRCDVPERRALSFFKWYVVHKEILEDAESEIKKTGEVEEFYSLLTHFKEIPGSVSENFKIKFKTFYDKYSGKLDRYELRKAISWFKEGKDYDEEVKRELEESAKVVEEMEKADLEKWNDSFEKIGDDEVDRVGNADYSSSDSIGPENKTIKELMEEQEKINKEFETEIQKSESQPDKVFADKFIDNISKGIMHLNMLNAKKKVSFSYENLKSLENIMDRLQEMIDSLNPDELKKEKEANGI